MSKAEKWRPIPSRPQLLASSHGRVMVIPYAVEMPKGGHRIVGGTPRVGGWGEGRMIFEFRGHSYKVARLVCEAFHGPPPFLGALALHVDENGRNNCPGNLKWGTQKENLNAPGFIKYCKGRTGQNSPRAKWASKKATR